MEKTDNNTEQRILEAARKVFIRKGMSGARMQDIADEAGINKALLHYYYRSKQKLFEMVFRGAAGELFVGIQDIIDSDRPAIQKLTAIAERYISAFSKSPYLPLFVMNEVNQNPKMITEFFKESAIQPALQRFFAQIQQEMDEGRFRKTSPPHLLINIISLCIFPFVANPILKTVFALDQWQLQLFMEERRKHVPEFIRNAILVNKAKRKKIN